MSISARPKTRVNPRMRSAKTRSKAGQLEPIILDLEPFFDEVVKRAGGYRVDALIPQNRLFDNADYYFESEGIFAELKVLQHDPDEDERLRLRLITVYQDFARGGKVSPISPTQRFARSELLPMEAQLKLLQPLKRRLQSPVKKAAKQLKETKQAFNREKDIGLLILVNEGSALFRPSTVFYLLHHLFCGGYSSIDHIIYCSVNVPASVPNIPDGARIWFPASVQHRKKIPDPFRQLLQSCWANVLEHKLGFKLPIIHCDGEPTLIDEVVFDKTELRGRSKRGG